MKGETFHFLGRVWFVATIACVSIPMNRRPQEAVRGQGQDYEGRGGVFGRAVGSVVELNGEGQGRMGRGREEVGVPGRVWGGVVVCCQSECVWAGECV